MITVLALAAFAQDQVVTLQYPIDIERFKPTLDTYGYAVTESSTTLQNLQVGVGLWGNYSDDPLVMRWNGERVIGPGPTFPDGLIDRRTVTDFHAGFGIADLFALMIDLPVVVWQDGFEPASEVTGDPVANLQSAGLGDLRIHPKFVVVDIHEGYPVGLAVLADFVVPTGNKRSFIGDGLFSATPIIAFEAANGSVHKREYTIRGAVNVGGRFKPVDTFRDVTLGPEFVYRAALSALPAPQFEIGADLAGATSGPRAANNPLEILPWLRLIPLDYAQLTLGGGFGLVPGVGTPDARAFVGATIGPNFKPLELDRDGDGIPNKLDACINIPEDKDVFEDEDGCPEDDNDRDGILDPVDVCPVIPEDFDNDRDTDGCPEDPDDSDGDGLVDDVDRCPYDPEDFDGWQDADGCPELDNDADGILDVADRCPFEPETYNGIADEDGCPDTASRVIVEKEKIVITEKIFFETGKAIIKEISFELLNEIARVMNEHPEVTRIQVEGHTDSDGSNPFNIKLSQSRAESVARFLVGAGVAESRLVAKGYGEEKPIETNATAEGKAQNRRVEFTILERD
ncbi:MAG: OmpA family protein [Deltaproteobacteria bacterium]|nr:OmpA family protein [Deltaproteobacteria bacterium]